MIDTHTLLEMSGSDIRSVDKSELVDIEDVHINTDLPLAQRVADYITQIKNPYCFKVAGTVVKIKFSNTDVTMEERMTGFLSSL